MRKNKIGSKLFIALLLASSTLAGAILTTNFVHSEQVQAYTNNDASTYYSGISESDTGDALLSKLRTLNNTKRKKTVGYKQMWNYYSQTDGSNGKFYAFYEGTLLNKGDMNKEHVWPESRGGNLVEGDIHMPRPSRSADNSSRGNSFFVENMASDKAGWDPYFVCQPKTPQWPKGYRGSAARIIFYCVVANSQLSLVDKTNDSTGNKTMGKLSDLLKWNLDNPVSEVDSVTHENQRNEAAESIQGNRNPFIDHPEYACKIWGNTNDSTRAICAKQYSATPLSLSDNLLDLPQGKSETLTANTNGTNVGEVSWSTSNSSVAAISQTTGKSITVTGVSLGTATITAKAKIDNKDYTATCTVNVVDATGYTYSLVRQASELNDGDQCLIVGHGANNGNNALDAEPARSDLPFYIKSQTVDVKNGEIAQKDLTEWTVKKSDNTFTFTHYNKDLYAYKEDTHSSINIGKSRTKDNQTTDVVATFNGTNQWTYEVVNQASGKANLYATLNTTPACKVYLTFDDGHVNFKGSASSSSEGIYIYKKGNITPPPTVSVTGVSLSETTATLNVGETLQLTATISPSNATNKNVTWASSDDAIATVTNGLVTAKKEGKATITVETVDGNKKAECVITVTKTGQEGTGTGEGDESKDKKKGCGGSLVTTSSLLAMLTLTMFSLLLIRRKKFLKK